MSAELTQKIFDFASVVVKEEGCELLEVEFAQDGGRRILRLYIGKPEGVQLEDCSRVSHALEDLIEVEQVISGRYNLEVSSPGINRPLRLKEHFQKAMGQMIKVVTKDKIDGRKHYKGILIQVENNNLIIKIDSQDFQVPIDEVSKANLIAGKQS